MSRLRHGSLFSGIGGFDLAAEWMGWENVFHCEWNEFGQQILNHYWPEAISYADITETDFTVHGGQIDVLTGGFPCQPYSQAGKRRGKDDERHLWPEMLRAIKEIEPRWIVGENVYGIVNWNGGMVFEEVQADLEDEGYSVQPYILPAAGVGAPHQRYRVWFVAYSGNKPGWSQQGCSSKREWELLQGEQQGGSIRSEGSGRSGKWSTPNPESERSPGLPVREEKKQSINGVTCINGDASDPEQCRRTQNNKQQQTKESEYAIPGWRRWPTQSPVRQRNDGLPPELDGITFPKWRRESIKAYGNAVVPQVVYQLFKTIKAYED